MQILRCKGTFEVTSYAMAAWMWQQLNTCKHIKLPQLRHWAGAGAGAGAACRGRSIHLSLANRFSFGFQLKKINKQSKFLQMYRAAAQGNVEELRENLRQDPTFNVNHRYGGGWTLLHAACYNGSDSVLPLLLVHPDIAVNQKDTGEQTPFILSFDNGNVGCIRRMLQDSRVNPNEPNNDGHTPLLLAVSLSSLTPSSVGLPLGGRWIWGNQGKTRPMPLGWRGSKESRKY